jgi:hypothetical protein
MIRRVFSILFMTALLLACALVFGCTRGEYDDQDPYDAYENPGGDGPEVLFDTHSEPSLIPFPNDLLTVEDKSTPTGRRINLPLGGVNEFQGRLRKRYNKLDGFGTGSAITVSFSHALDLSTITQDSVHILNIQKDSARYGERTEVAFDPDYYPVDLENPESFYPNDPNADAPNILFSKGNRWRYYEDETNTLILRPLTPLQQTAKHAVVLTTKLRDGKGFAVRPPDYFKYLTFPTMLEDAYTAVQIMSSWPGTEELLEEVAFVWSFTTQSISGPLENARAGLYGEGPFSYLHDEYPPKITQIDKFSVEIDGDGDEYRLDASFFTNLLNILGPLLEGGANPIDVMIMMENVDYIVGGSFTSPNFLNTEYRYMEWDWLTGEAQLEPEEATFFISVPKPCEANNFAQPPYPVVIFQHANIRNRLDSVFLANAMAGQGFATIGMDAAEHGPELYLWAAYAVLSGLQPMPEGLGEFAIDTLARLLTKLLYPSKDLSDMSTEEVIDWLFSEETFFGSAFRGRSIDEDLDGIPDGGNTFFSADIFRTKAISNQTNIDLFQLVRVLKNLGSNFDGDGRLSREEGDFNQDGVLDVGGAYNKVYFAGMSLGTLIGTGFVALEPEIETAVLNVPGAILTDVLQRTGVPNVNAKIRMDLIGPLVVGRPTPQGDVALTFNKMPIENTFARIGSYPGMRVTLNDLDSGEVRSKKIHDDGSFAINIAADKGDQLRLSVVDDNGNVLEQAQWAQEFRGMGVERNTPVARNFVHNAQWAIDPADPFNFAPFFQLYPRPGNTPKKVLIQLCMPDQAVPTSGGINLARAAGFIDDARQVRLKNLGVFDYGYSTFNKANRPLQSTSNVGLRIHPGYNHEYLMAPQNKENSIMYSFVSKNQMAIFFATDGEWIEDNPWLLVPPEYIVEGY